MQLAGGHFQRQHADTGAFGVHHQIEREELDEELRLVRQRLLVQGMQHGVTRAVGGSTGALGSALAVVGGHATERALVDAAILGA